MSAEAAAWDGGLVGGEDTTVAERRRRPLGALLVEAGVASEAGVREALDEGNRTGERLGEVVLRRGWVSERKLTKLLAEQWGLRAPGPVKMQVDPAALARIDREVAAELGGVPFEFDADGLVVAVAEPKADRFEAFRALLGNVSFVVVAPSTLTELLDARAAMLGTTSSPAERVGAWLRPPTESPQAAEETNGNDFPDEAPLDDIKFEEEPMETTEQLLWATQQDGHEPTDETAPITGSVVERLDAMTTDVEKLEHELAERRRRLEARETELAELRQAHASDLDTISRLGAGLDDRRRRLDALRTVDDDLPVDPDWG
jgi:hypothetical protein